MGCDRLCHGHICASPPITPQSSSCQINEVVHAMLIWVKAGSSQPMLSQECDKYDTTVVPSKMVCFGWFPFKKPQKNGVPFASTLKKGRRDPTSGAEECTFIASTTKANSEGISAWPTAKGLLSNLRTWGDLVPYRKCPQNLPHLNFSFSINTSIRMHLTITLSCLSWVESSVVKGHVHDCLNHAIW